MRRPDLTKLIGFWFQCPSQISQKTEPGALDAGPFSDNLDLPDKSAVPEMRLATFNLQNLRLRRRQGTQVLDGAVDHDFDDRPRPIARDIADRHLTAKIIASAQPDVIALQEVFDAETLDFFHDHFLLECGLPPYPYRICIDGNDGRGLDVAALSRKRLLDVTSHAHMTGADFGLSDLPENLLEHPLFRRDCLQLEFDSFTLFICHFKAPYPDREKAHQVREAEARAVRKIIENRFSRPGEARWIIAGDFNEPAPANGAAPSALAPLQGGFSVDLLDRLTRGTDWTFETPDTLAHSRPDRIFLSPELARIYPDVVPHIMRMGMTRHLAEPDLSGPQRQQFPGVHASDHALVYADLPGL